LFRQIEEKPGQRTQNTLQMNTEL